jgi:hypothetical protein
MVNVILARTLPTLHSSSSCHNRSSLDDDMNGVLYEKRTSLTSLKPTCQQQSVSRVTKHASYKLKLNKSEDPVSEDPVNCRQTDVSGDGGLVILPYSLQCKANPER